MITLNRTTLGIVMVGLAALGFGLMPIFALFAYQHQVTLFTLLVLRFAIAAGVFFALTAKDLKNLRLTAREWGKLFLLGGVFYTVQAMCYLSSVKYIPASLTSILLYTYPIFVSLFSVLLGREKLNRRTVAAGLAAFAGLILVLNASLDHVNLWGVALALGAGITYSVYILVGSTVLNTINPMVTSAFVSLFALFSLSVIGVASGDLNFRLDITAYLSILAVALFSTVVAISTFFVGVKYIGPVKASILSNLEPLITTVCAFFFLQQQLTWLQGLGGLIVLAGGLIVVLEKQEKPPQGYNKCPSLTS